MSQTNSEQSAYSDTSVNKDILALKQQADLVRNQGNIDKAIELYGSVLKLKPDYIDAHFEVMHLLNDNEDQEITKKAFNDEVATVALAQAYAAKVQQLMIDGNSKEALSWCLVLSELLPEGVDVWMMMGVLYVTLDRQKEAVISFLKALELDPDNPVCRNYFIDNIISEDVNNPSTYTGKYAGQTFYLEFPAVVDAVESSFTWQ